MIARRRRLPLRAEGHLVVDAPPATVQRSLLDPLVLEEVVPGAERVTRERNGSYRAVLALGVGPFRDRQIVTLWLERQPGGRIVLSGRATGAFGTGEAAGQIDLRPQEGGTMVSWRYDGTIRGPVTLLGSTVLRISATHFANRAFASLRRALERPSRVP